ncbi:MAG TPA: helix-turn-helix transcriptional regulator, partial [Oligoflexia bacterium]|nr:helix-turn-helix transcriptional regulator [Oligoflexia bacterium]
SEFTKISKNYLQAVEDEDYDSLPAAVYTRGFVFQIAKSLKIPHDKASSGYMTRYSSKRK